jgi:Lon protease-like protein
VPDRIPLFPLSTVLYPGGTLPLHIFEERYRVLVRRLLDHPDGTGRAFGVVAIRVGRESGVDGVTALYEVGCIAQVRGVEAYEDGRFDLETTGTRRFRLLAVDTAEPYLSGEVEWLGEPEGDAAAVLAAGVAQRFTDYRDTLYGFGVRGDGDGDALPDDPTRLSYRVASSAVMDLADHQALLAAPDTAARLGLELDLLRREAGLLRDLPSLPGVEYTRKPAAPN